MKPFTLKRAVEALRKNNPLVHCITNYVTVNDCANALLACGASPIMSDEPADVEDITTICSALVLNIGTLNKHSIEGMHKAAARASKLEHPIILDPVGAGASALRTKVAAELLQKYNVSVVRGNMSEVKALYAALYGEFESAQLGSNGDTATGVNGVTNDENTDEHTSTRGVDVAESDIVDANNMDAAIQFARAFAQKAGVVVAITGAVDIVASADECYTIHNGSALCARITGAGCMLSCTLAAYVASGILQAGAGDGEGAGAGVGEGTSAGAEEGAEHFSHKTEATQTCETQAQAKTQTKAQVKTQTQTQTILESCVAAVSAHGVCGEVAQSRMQLNGNNNAMLACGNGSFRTYFLDALYNLNGNTLEEHARVECAN